MFMYVYMCVSVHEKVCLCVESGGQKSKSDSSIALHIVLQCQSLSPFLIEVTGALLHLCRYYTGVGSLSSGRLASIASALSNAPSS